MPVPGFTPSFGWLNKPAEVEKIKAELAIRTFRQIWPAQRCAGEHKDVMLWLAEEKFAGRFFPCWDQGSIGSCVAHGWGRAVQDLICGQGVATPGQLWPGAEVCREAIYGGSRIEVGHDGGGDGSTGAWAAKWCSQWGQLFYLAYPGQDLTGGYTVSRCGQWGDRGVPDALEPTAKLHPVKVAAVESSEEASDAIASGKPVAICGDVSRTMERKPGGWCPQTGRDWPHCQELAGSVVVKGGAGSARGGDGAYPWAGALPALVYRNSWGNYLGSANATVTLASGQTFDLPEGCYLSTFEEANPDLRQGDSFCVSDFTPFVDPNPPPPPPPPPPPGPLGCLTQLIRDLFSGVSILTAFVSFVGCLFHQGAIDQKQRHQLLNLVDRAQAGQALPWSICLSQFILAVLSGTPLPTAIAAFVSCMLTRKE